MEEGSHFRRLERMYHAAPVTRLYGTRLEIREGEATVTLPVREEFFHAGGRLEAEATLVDETGEEVAHGKGTFLARGPKLTPEIGYR